MTMINAAIRARGMVRCGSLTSSPAVDTASRPMKEKKIVPAAVPIAALPSGAKSVKLAPLNAVNEITTNISSTASLITTMIAFNRADSLAPRMSSSMQSPTRITAGRLMIPVAPSPLANGAARRSGGSETPVMLVTASLR